MIAVIDASVVVNALTNDRLTALAEYTAHYDLVVTPTHFDAEVGSALRGMWLGRRLDRENFRALTLRMPGIPIIRSPIDNVLSRIVDLADNVTFYDAAYIALAEALDADLLTADKRLAAVPGVTCDVIVL